jgi:hypothetical protein
MSDNLPFDGESVMSDAPFVCRSCDGQYLNPRMDRLRACFPTGVIYVTVLRDPIEMVLSSVSYVELQHDWEKTGMYDMQKNFVDVELTPSGTALRLVNGTTEVLSHGNAFLPPQPCEAHVLCIVLDRSFPFRPGGTLATFRPRWPSLARTVSPGRQRGSQTFSTRCIIHASRYALRAMVG